MAKLPPLERLTSQANLPSGWMGRALAATPVIMTVIATLLAGLASSEMTKAQYERAYAAQLQSKAGDQWAFFQAKRLRGEMQRNTLDALREPFAPTNVPAAPPPPTVTPELQEIYDAVGRDAPAEDINARLAELDASQLADALRDEKRRVTDYDALTAPRLKDLVDAPASRRLAFNASRYDEEAKLNAAVARVYELQVRKTNLQAERHHRRSQRFFFGMLAAQAAVIVATFAIAARQKNLLWALAAGAGLLAVCFAVYVYLYI